MSQEYTPEQVEEQADRVGIVGEDVGKTATMLRAYAATLRQAARVDEEGPNTLIRQLRGRAAFLRDKGRVKSPQLIEQAADELEAALSAQPAPRCDKPGCNCAAWKPEGCAWDAAQPAKQGEAVAEVYAGAFGAHYIACADPNKLPVGAKFYLHPAAPVGVGVPDVKAMVDRFLRWPLPDDFAPDCGINFKRAPDARGYAPSWPIGTNLLTAAQAEAMLRHVLANVTVPDWMVLVPRALTAENGAKAVLMGEFTTTITVTCHECDGDGFVDDNSCEVCDGSGTLDQVIPIDWTTIKAIYAAAIKHFAAAPSAPQEVER